MKISDLIKTLEKIKKEKGDLIVCNDDWGCRGVSGIEEKGIQVVWLERPTGRKKLYQQATSWGKEKEDLEVVYFFRSGKQKLEE